MNRLNKKTLLMTMIAFLPLLSGAADTEVVDPIPAAPVPEMTTMDIGVSADSSVVSKYVRNVSRPNGYGESIKIGDDLFYERTGEVKADTDDVLEYAIVINSSDTDFSNVSVSDSIPPYTVYIQESTTMNAMSVADINGKSPVMHNMRVNDSLSALHSGMIKSGASVVVLYRVRVDLMMDIPGSF